jgi:hypothetical protein
MIKPELSHCKISKGTRESLPPNAARAILSECYDPNAPKAKVDNIDDIANKLAGSDLDDDDDAVGF